MNKSNHFLLLKVMVGTVNTPDEAYRVLYYEREARQHAFDLAMAARIEFSLRAKKLRTRSWFAWTESAKAALLADAMRLQSDSENHLEAVKRATADLAFINEVMTKLEPLCKYRTGDLNVDFQACQAEEWALEYIKRARRFLMTQPAIPSDHLEMMAAHPWFASVILPAVQGLVSLRAEHGGGLPLSLLTEERPAFLDDLYESYPALTAPEREAWLIAEPPEPLLVAGAP